MRPREPLPPTAEVIAVLGVLRPQEGDEVLFYSIKLLSGLDIGAESMDAKGIPAMLAYGCIQTRVPAYAVLGRPELLVKVLLKAVTLMLAYIVLACDVINNEIDEQGPPIKEGPIVHLLW
jgi:hypothetical protein